MSRDRRIMSPLRAAHDFDARRMAPGLRESNNNPNQPASTHWVEGNGLAPLGWEPWDYEQQQGYPRLSIGVMVDRAWDRLDTWTLDEIGVHLPDLSDEMEDWDLGPCRRRYDRDWASRARLFRTRS